jgi:hypothetical protein
MHFKASIRHIVLFRQCCTALRKYTVNYITRRKGDKPKGIQLQISVTIQINVVYLKAFLTG